MYTAKLITTAIYVALIVGWVIGLVKFFQCDFEPSYKAEVIYGLGIITGYNSVVGYFDLGK